MFQRLAGDLDVGASGPQVTNCTWQLGSSAQVLICGGQGFVAVKILDNEHTDLWDVVSPEDERRRAEHRVAVVQPHGRQ